MLRNMRDGNWITGISVIDNALYGNQELMPDSLKSNKAHNTLFALPLISFTVPATVLSKGIFKAMNRLPTPLAFVKFH